MLTEFSLLEKIVDILYNVENRATKFKCDISEFLSWVFTWFPLCPLQRPQENMWMSKCGEMMFHSRD